MTDLFDAQEGQTELTPDEKKGLKPAYITYRDELNEAEQENIVKAERWLSGRKVQAAPLDFANEDFIREVHKRMYGDVWNWAGTYRTSDRNIGVDFYLIRQEMYKFIGDAQWWIQKQTFPLDELAVRFHHRLVWIHPFPNGNGRLCRLLADHLAMRLGAQRFSWGTLVTTRYWCTSRRFTLRRSVLTAGHVSGVSYARTACLSASSDCRR